MFPKRKQLGMGKGGPAATYFIPHSLSQRPDTAATPGMPAGGQPLQRLQGSQCHWGACPSKPWVSHPQE